MWWNFTQISLNGAGQVRYNRRLALFPFAPCLTCLIMSERNYQAPKRSERKKGIFYFIWFCSFAFFCATCRTARERAKPNKIKNNKDSTLFGGLFASAKSVTKSVRPTPIYSHWSAPFKLICVFIPPHLLINRVIALREQKSETPGRAGKLFKNTKL